MPPRFDSWIASALRVVLPLIFALLLYVPVQDAIHRWPTAAEALRKYPQQTAVLLRSTIHSVGDGWTRSASYVLLPSFQGVEIIVSSSNPPQVKETSALLGVLTALTYLLGIGWLTVWYWVRRPPNNRWRGP